MPRAPRNPVPSSAPASSRPPVVVTLVIDQFAAWIAAERLSLLPSDGGFARLLREGTYVREARYAHATTDTAPGHAALYTGAPPRVTGIVANELMDASGHGQAIVRDDQTRLVTPDGVSKAVGASLVALAVPTVADLLRVAHPNAFIASFSLKDRGTLFAAGRHPDIALWYDPALDTFVTSTAFTDRFPRWAIAAGGHDALVRLRRTPWQPLDPVWIQAHARTPDNQPGEADLGGYGIVFPHDVTASKAPAQAFRASPYGDETLVALATAAIAANPTAGHVPTLIAVSLSSNDLIGHTFGPDSWEAWDELLRLDRLLARFFHTLDASFGPMGYAVLLSADHGVAPLPETATVAGARPWCVGGQRDRWQRPCDLIARLSGDELWQSLQTAAKVELGEGEWVRGVADPYVYLSPSAQALDPVRYDRLVHALLRFLRQRPEIAVAIDPRTLPAACPPPSDETVEALICRSVKAGASVGLYVANRPGSFFTPSLAKQGTSHGTPHLYDRTVPLLVRAPGRAMAGRVIDEPVATAAFARTVAALFGLAPPPAALPARDLLPVSPAR